MHIIILIACNQLLCSFHIIVLMAIEYYTIPVPKSKIKIDLKYQIQYLYYP